MTLDEHLESITFWEPFNGNYYVLKEEEGNKRITDKHETTKYLNQTKLQ